VKDLKTYINLILKLVLLFLSMSCRPTGPKTGFQDLGLQIIPIDRISFPDTINTSDTLIIRFWSGEVWDASAFSRFDVVKDSFEIGVTAWADVRKWIGTDPMPPTDLWPLDSTACTIPPSFISGSLRIIIHQPGGAILVDTIHVKA
jgi:hypothetical protein